VKELSDFVHYPPFRWALYFLMLGIFIGMAGQIEGSRRAAIKVAWGITLALAMCFGYLVGSK
jgi:hypothetical protein